MSKENGLSFRSRQAEVILAKPELTELMSWYKEQLESFGEIEIKDAPLTDGVQWKRELTEKGEVDKVDGSFFVLTGQTVTKFNLDGSISFGWTQPGLIQKESEVNLPTKEGEERVKISGFVGAILDEEKRVLITLAQEPFAHTPKSVVARTPFQTSASKLQGIVEGKRELDPQLFDLIGSLVPGKDPVEVLRLGVLDVFPLPYADANRIDATNLGFVLQIMDKNLTRELENNGKNRWCTKNEVATLAKAGILNGHTSAAVLASLA